MYYVYHPDFPPRVVESEEYEKFLQDGWYDSPAKIPAKRPISNTAKPPKLVTKQPELVEEAPKLVTEKLVTE